MFQFGNETCSCSYVCRRLDLIFVSDFTDSDSPNIYYHTTLVQDTVVKPVSECHTVVDFAAARDDGHGSKL